MKQTYKLTVGHTTRQLNIVPISETTAIASFVLLGDARLTHEAAEILKTKIPDSFDYIVTPETKGIPLAYDLSVETLHTEYIILRKDIKPYMQNPIVTAVSAITTTGAQQLVLDGIDAKKMSGKKVIFLDDVISTGGSLNATEELLAKVGAKIVAKVAILAEGDAAKREDIIYLEKLPLFDINEDGTYTERD
ncbi:MAG: adenine phosphoribosyltransferase [Lactobacillaceae bacterium]|jgi:adenine phosphoribosyltransferase|nr:adenine phosphoribosyltransferase [Lactobacillaceae bacterium]